MKKLISKLEENEYIKTISLIALVLSALITVGSFFIKTGEYLNDNVFISSNITNQIKHLSAGQDIEYFKKYLGSQILKRNVTKNSTEYIFNYKGAYIQAVASNQDDTVVYWAITDCNSNPVVLERPAFQNLTNKLFLNKDTFSSFLKEEKGDIKIFISGATANSFAYESVYLGNPSAYQTIIVGVNNICPVEDLYGHLDADETYSESHKPNEQAINNFRKKIKINTYAETSPFMGEEIISLLRNIHSEKANEPYLDFGADRIKIRTF